MKGEEGEVHAWAQSKKSARPRCSLGLEEPVIGPRPPPSLRPRTAVSAAGPSGETWEGGARAEPERGDASLLDSVPLLANSS